MVADTAVANPSNGKTPRIGGALFSALLLLLIAASIVRSAIATRLDGFTIDEAYHIAAGVSYVRLGDFRINPEHPRWSSCGWQASSLPLVLEPAPYGAFPISRTNARLPKKMSTSTTIRTPCRDAHESPCLS